MSSCGVCEKPVNRIGHEKIQCFNCKTYCHASCVELGGAELEFFSNKEWRCDSCMMKYRADRNESENTPIKYTPALSAQRSTITDNEIGKILDSFKREILAGQERLEKSLGASIESCHTIIADLSRSLSEQREVVKNQQEKIQLLETENIALKKSLFTVRSDLVDLEQYSRRNTLEIYGVPKIQGENVVQTVLKIGDSLGVNMEMNDIDACHRLERRTASSSGIGTSSPGIIVKFVRRSLADRLIEAKRGIRSLSTRHLGMAMDSQVFINFSLCKARRSLLAAARMAKRKSIFRHVWVDRAGKVKVRKVDNGRVWVINNEYDLSCAENDD